MSWSTYVEVYLAKLYTLAMNENGNEVNKPSAMKRIVHTTNNT